GDAESVDQPYSKLFASAFGGADASGTAALAGTALHELTGPLEELSDPLEDPLRQAHASWQGVEEKQGRLESVVALVAVSHALPQVAPITHQGEAGHRLQGRSQAAQGVHG